LPDHCENPKNVEFSNFLVTDEDIVYKAGPLLMGTRADAGTWQRESQEFDYGAGQFARMCPPSRSSVLEPGTLAPARKAKTDPIKLR
jgi:hypothetical protein